VLIGTKERMYMNFVMKTTYIMLIGLMTAAAHAGNGSGWGAFAGGLFAGSVIANASAPRERVIVERPTVVERVIERPTPSYRESTKYSREQELQLQQEANRKLELENKKLELEIERLKLQKMQNASTK
jgi:hypothetical protein